MVFCRKFALPLALVFLCLFLLGPGEEAPSPLAAMAAPEAAAREEIRLPVIMYHGISTDQGRVGDYVVTPEMFARDMAYLQSCGYETVFVSEILDYVDMGMPLPARPVLVTFDDGMYSIRHYLQPIMEEMGLKAVVNVEGAFTQRAMEEKDPNPAYAYLTWEDIGTLERSGCFEIGNHTYDMHHRQGSRLGCRIRAGETQEAYARALREDVGHLQALLEDYCHTTPVTFAYPYGFISQESVPVLEDMGFRVLLTCFEKPNFLRIAPEETLLLHRYNRSGNLTTAAFMAKLFREDVTHTGVFGFWLNAPYA